MVKGSGLTRYRLRFRSIGDEDGIYSHGIVLLGRKMIARC